MAAAEIALALESAARSTGAVDSVATTGLCEVQKRVVVVEGPDKEDQMAIHPVMYMALSYDHRIVDGREAVTFLVRVKEAIEDPTRLLIDL